MRRAVSPDLARLLPRSVLPLALFFAAVVVFCEATRSAGAFREAVGSKEGGGSTNGSGRRDRSQSVTWTAWPLARGDSGRIRCAAVCGTDWRRGEEQCGVDLEFSGFERDASVVGIQLDVALGVGAQPDALQAYGLEGEVDVEYRVYDRRR